MLFGAIAAFSLALVSASAATAEVNLLPAAGATVTGSTIYSGFNDSIAGSNLLNGTSVPAYANGDPRWVFADGSNTEETLTVDLGSVKTGVNYAEYGYNGVDRIPTSFSVLTSTDGTNFTQVAPPSATTSADYGLPGIYTSAYSFAPTNAQYVEYDFGVNSIGTGCSGCGGGVGQGAGIYFLDIQSAVPEPTTWVMMILGLGVLGVAMRRRINLVPA